MWEDTGCASDSPGLTPLRGESADAVMETLGVMVPRLSLFAAVSSDRESCCPFLLRDAFPTGVSLLETTTSPFAPLLEMVLFLVTVSVLSDGRWTKLDRPTMGSAGIGRRTVLAIMLLALKGSGPESLPPCA